MINEKKVIETVAEVYKICQIKKFPIDCVEILRILNIELVPYGRLSKDKRNACMKISPDAFCMNETIFYNDFNIYTRIRFSVMHELGHILMNHAANDPDKEREADLFASWMLSPRVDLILCKKLTNAEVARRYDVSIKAAEVIIEDYKKWQSRSRLHMYTAELELQKVLDIQKKKNQADQIEKMINRPRLYTDPLPPVTIKLRKAKNKREAEERQRLINTLEEVYYAKGREIIVL